MKISRLIQFPIYACVLLIVGSFCYQALFASGEGSSGGFGYGNLFVQHSIHEQGVGILKPKVEWLIATPEMPLSQTYKGDEDKWTFTYSSGKVFTISPDSKHLIWVDPESGPQKITATLDEELIQCIKDTRESSADKKFNSGGEFLAWVESSNAQQAAASNGDKQSN